MAERFKSWALWMALTLRMLALSTTASRRWIRFVVFSSIDWGVH